MTLGIPGRIALFAAYTVLSVAGLVMIKHALAPAMAAARAGDLVTTHSVLVAAGASSYIASFAVWMVILATTELTVAYPVAIGLTLALSAFAAVAMLGEHMGLLRIAGAALIFAGVCCIAWSR